VVLSAGTRNHFARDLGLGLDDPGDGLAALTDGVDMMIDLGVVNGLPFVNNVSFGVYADIVQSPAYRDAKLHTALALLPQELDREHGPALRVQVDGGPEIVDPVAVLVSNNPYSVGDPSGFGRRTSLDSGQVGVVVVAVDDVGGAAGLVMGGRRPSSRRILGSEVVASSDAERIAVGVDGEAVMLATPVRCCVRAGVLRVRVPRSCARPPHHRIPFAPGGLFRLAAGRM
jgi:diacylglycerol kinase family enzyme